MIESNPISSETLFWIMQKIIRIFSIDKYQAAERDL